MSHHDVASSRHKTCFYYLSLYYESARNRMFLYLLITLQLSIQLNSDLVNTQCSLDCRFLIRCVTTIGTTITPAMRMADNMAMMMYGTVGLRLAGASAGSVGSLFGFFFFLQRANNTTVEWKLLHYGQMNNHVFFRKINFDYDDIFRNQLCLNPDFRPYSNTSFVSSHIMYPENTEGTQVIVGSMNMGCDIYSTLTGSIFQPVPSKMRADFTRTQWRMWFH